MSYIFFQANGIRSPHVIGPVAEKYSAIYFHHEVKRWVMYPSLRMQDSYELLPVNWFVCCKGDLR